MTDKSTDRPRVHPGDIVDITVKRVRVVGVNALHGTPITIADENGDEYPMPPQAAVARVVPAEWPPRAGDLWRDKHGELWFVFKNPSVMQPEPELLGRTAGGARWTDDASALIDDNAPLALVRREEADGA